MTPARRRLVALAAALVPGRAEALLGRCADATLADLAHAAALATAPRRERLASLAAALPAPARPTPFPAQPLLRRLALEAAAARTVVRGADAPPSAAG